MRFPFCYQFLAPFDIRDFSLEFGWGSNEVFDSTLLLSGLAIATEFNQSVHQQNQKLIIAGYRSSVLSSTKPQTFILYNQKTKTFIPKKPNLKKTKLKLLFCIIKKKKQIAHVLES